MLSQYRPAFSHHVPHLLNFLGCSILLRLLHRGMNFPGSSKLHSLQQPANASKVALHTAKSRPVSLLLLAQLPYLQWSPTSLFMPTKVIRKSLHSKLHNIYCKDQQATPHGLLPPPL